MYLFGPQYNPYIINGMVDSNILTTISANPNLRDSVPVYRSMDQTQGVEFSWNVWFFVSDTGKMSSNNSLIFSKGKSNTSDPFLGVSPGLYLTNTNQSITYKTTINGKNIRLSFCTMKRYKSTVSVQQIRAVFLIIYLLIMPCLLSYYIF